MLVACVNVLELLLMQNIRPELANTKTGFGYGGEDD
jgi:hypothetical protein